MKSNGPGRWKLGHILTFSRLSRENFRELCLWVLNRRDLNFCMGTSPLCGTAVNVVQEEVEDKLDGGTLSMD